MTRKSYTESLNSFKETRSKEILRAANRIISYKSRYEEVEKLTGVPWDFIGVIHLRESNLDFETHLHNGDPLTAKTKHVPKGRPPGRAPFTWIESAVDALKMKKFDQKTDWSMEAICDYLERYNGLGYKNKGQPSPYLWAGTNQYTKGKYVADGEYDPNTVDKQLGCIPVLTKIRFLEDQAPPKKEIVASSRKLTVLQRIRNAVVGLTGSIMALDWMDVLSKAKQFATDHSGLILVLGAASVWGAFKLIEYYTIQDYHDGRYIPSKEQK